MWKRLEEGVDKDRREKITIIPHPMHAGYFAGDDGCVYSSKSGVLKRMDAVKNTTGYYTVSVWENGKSKRVRVSRFICYAFNGAPIAIGSFALHLDGNPENNKPNNLKWGDQLENKRHELNHGTRVFGEAHYRSDMSNDKRVAVYSFAKSESRKPVATAAKKFGLSYIRAWKICNSPHVARLYDKRVLRTVKEVK